MQEAADESEAWSASPPDEGLEFEIGDDTADRFESADTGDQPFPEPPALESDEIAQIASPDTEDAPFVDDTHQPTRDEYPPFADASPAPAEDAGEAWNRGLGEPVSEDTATAAAADEDPFGAMPLEPLEPMHDEDEDEGDEVAADVGPSEFGHAAPDREIPAERRDDGSGDEEIDVGSADTSPMVAESGPPAWQPPMSSPVAHVEPPEEPEPVVADMENAGDTSAAVAPAAPPEPETSAAGGLSDDDVERIARRVVELAADRLEQIAWEVVPDMAEIVVRERVRELEAQIEGATPDPVQ